MQYAILIYDEETANPSPEPPDPEILGQVMAAYNGYTQMLKDRGAYVGGEALQPTPTATTCPLRTARRSRPTARSRRRRKALGGFYLIEARDLDEALELAAQCPGRRDRHDRGAADLVDFGAGPEARPPERVAGRA